MKPPGLGVGKRGGGTDHEVFLFMASDEAGSDPGAVGENPADKLT